MKKLLIFICSLAFGYLSCSMCHNGRTAPKLDNMSKKEIIQKLLAMKNSKTNPKMDFIKYMNNKEIKQMVNQLKEKK